MQRSGAWRTFLTLFLLIAACLTSWAYDFEVDGIYYNINGTNATVTYEASSGGSYSGDVVIPETVTYNETTYSVTEIGSYAFNYCTGLTSIIIPSSVTKIGSWAFFLCDGLTSVTIPDSVTEIGRAAFRSTGLTSVIIPNSITAIGQEVFLDCHNLTSVVIPASVTTIGDSAFCGCSERG